MIQTNIVIIHIEFLVFMWLNMNKCNENINYEEGGVKFGTTKCRTTNFSKFQICEYQNNERSDIRFFINFEFIFYFIFVRIFRTLKIYDRL